MLHKETKQTMQGTEVLRNHVTRAAMTLLAVLFTSATVWADNVMYLDPTAAIGQQHKRADATPMTGSTTSLTSGWYYVSDAVTNGDRINVSGTVNLILADGCDFTATNGIRVTSGNTLNIYAQSAGGNRGSLTVGHSGDDAAIGGNGGRDGNDVPWWSTERDGTPGEDAGNISIFGGTITATGNIGGGNGGIGGYYFEYYYDDGDNNEEYRAGDGGDGGNGGIITIYSSHITVDGIIGGGNGGPKDESYVFGYAERGNDGKNGSGTVNLSWANASDRIQSTQYNGTVTLVKSFVDGNGNAVTSATVADKTIKPAGTTYAVSLTSWFPQGILADVDLVEEDGSRYAVAGQIVNIRVDGLPEGRTSDMELIPECDVVDNGDCSYSFQMPDEDVAVDASLALVDWETLYSGTEDDPYIIDCKAQLDLLAQRVNGAVSNYCGKYFKLVTDIAYNPNVLDADGNNYTPIGTASFYYFGGNFDGDNHVISGIRINKGDGSQGLFGKIDCYDKSTSFIKNIILADAVITGGSSAGGIVGCLLYGTVSNCHVLSNVTIGKNDMGYGGGIVGLNRDGIIEDCTCAASVTGNFGGGIAGENTSTVSGCVYLGNSLDGGMTFGAIVGWNHQSVWNCHFTSTDICGKSIYGDQIDNADCAIGTDDHNSSPQSTVTNCGLAMQDTQDNGSFFSVLAARTATFNDKPHNTALDATVDLKLIGRTIDTDWNTLALPFSVSADSLAVIFGADVKLYELTGSSLDEEVLGLEFTSATSIEASKPYFIKASANVETPTFKGVTVEALANDTVKTDFVDFIPTLGVTEITGNPWKVLVLGANNTLYNPASLPAKMKAFRGFFRVHGVAANAAQFRMTFDAMEDDVTGIISIDNGKLIIDNSDAVYNLMGQKVKNASAREIHVVKGKRVMVKP